MLPRLPQQSNTSPKVTRFLDELLALSFDGDVSTLESDLAAVSTDNSIWQVTPQAVLSPRSHFGVEQIVKQLSMKTHRNVSITPRGGGTSTAGQSLTNSIVLDCKKFMNSIIDFNEETNQVHVECGAVLQSVNDELKQFGVKIGPTVATASRATIGGMVGNDSAGKGSRVFGKTSDCVVELKTVLGNDLTTNNPDLINAIKEICDTARPHFNQYWPNLPRFVSGYNLPMTWDETTLDINRLFCGSEGTLGVTTSAILQCVPISNNQKLVLLCFDSFDSALRCGASLLKHNPMAIEVVDEMVLKTARNDICWQSISTILGGARDDTNAVLIVECNNETTILAEMCEHKPLLVKTITDPVEQENAWSFRSRSVGLLSSLHGTKRPVPFVEDCVVPPKKLPDFIKDFKKILNNHDLQVGMFGHVDAGVIHVRPALDLQKESDRDLIRIVSKQVVSLVRLYGGVLWGEHGKGFRSEFGPEIFGELIWNQMCNIKKTFDPYNQFNPGKVAIPDDSFSIATIDEKTRSEIDSKSASLPVISSVTKCDGNSECHSISTDSSMCPTYRATDEETSSPRGRAEVLRHWLRRLDINAPPTKSSFIRRIFNSGTENDLNHEVRSILDGCLSCKACSSNCPMKIDIPSLRSKFYDVYYGRYLRPLRDLVWLNMETAISYQKLLPAKLFASLVGVCDIPKPTNELTKLIKTSTPEQIVKENPDVVLMQDTFTTYFRPAPFLAMLKILRHLEIQVAILPIRPSGKPLHVRGALDTFNKTAKDNIDWIMPVSNLKIPIIGIDPATTLLWRDEYPNNNVDVLLPQEWLITQDLSCISLTENWRLFPHCIEKSTAIKSSEQWSKVFELIGSQLEIVKTSCCGMGGLFGHQKENRKLSFDVWNIHWAQNQPSELNTLATGFSCHSQAKRVEGIYLKHPLEAIANPIA
ncbi:MAG: FAD-binding and (Fe-S)-binding domain-containing protein [Phycisphaerales bacterium]|jgi:FAD/FMN-containing dehydrogenase/Fe-S oxidoreductase|nr:FAD-binding and (Fe-S)-binding domain-containing protein [Phycisphaerales bacterium]